MFKAIRNATSSQMSCSKIASEEQPVFARRPQRKGERGAARIGCIYDEISWKALESMVQSKIL